MDGSSPEVDELQLYGLLRLDDQQPDSGLKTASVAERGWIYIRDAINLSATLRSQGLAFKVLTNKMDAVNDYASSHRLDVTEIPFTTEVPRGTRFYSAHFKLDVFRYLSTLKAAYVGLCDLDIACINPYPECLRNIVRARTPLVYDISDQVIPAYGHEVILRDLKAIHGLDGEGRWYGGEFIAGPPEFFSALVHEIDGVYPNYLKALSKMHALGDETFTSAGLELLRRQGMCVADAGALGIVGRYWNADVLSPQRPFGYFKHCFLLHLPADKIFLADLASDGDASSKFFTLYARRRRRAAPERLLRSTFRAVKARQPSLIAPRRP